MKKITALALALLMLAAAVLFTGCGETEPEGASTTAAPSAETTAAQETEPEYVPDDLPDSLKFDGDATFALLADEDQFSLSFTEDEGDGSIIESALLSRQQTVEDRLGFRFSFIRKKGGYSNASSFCNTVLAAYKSNTNDYDLVVAYNMTPAMMAAKGILFNLTDDSSYLNFRKPWWGSEAYKTIAVNGKVYFMTDNCSYNTIKNMLAVYVNRDMAEDNGIPSDDLYSAAENGSWTMEEMFRLCADVYEDTDRDNAKSAGDTFGLSSGNAVWNEGWYYAAGLISTEVHDDGTYEFTLGDEKTADFLDWFNTKFHGSNGVYKSDPEQYRMFLDARAMFYLSAVAITKQDIKYDYFALPMPKYNADQSMYYTHFSNTYDMWAVPVTASDCPMSTAVLEALASGAYRTVCPAYYEQYLKFRKSVDARASAMYDTIRAGIVFDFGYVYGLCFSGENTTINVRRHINNAATDWTSSWKSMEKQYDREIKTLLDKIS